MKISAYILRILFVIFSAEIGDYIIEEYADHTYLLQLTAFVPNQNEELLKKVMEYHKQHMYVYH